jgi:hypothetical protein
MPTKSYTFGNCEWKYTKHSLDWLPHLLILLHSKVNYVNAPVLAHEFGLVIDEVHIYTHDSPTSPAGPADSTDPPDPTLQIITFFL